MALNRHVIHCHDGQGFAPNGQPLPPDNIMRFIESEIDESIARTRSAAAKEAREDFANKLKKLPVISQCLHKPMNDTVWNCLDCGATVHPDGRVDHLPTMDPVFTESQRKAIDFLLKQETK